MIVGVFFSEIGIKLLVYFSDVDPQLEKIRDHLADIDEWSKEEFFRMSRTLRDYPYTITADKVDLQYLRSFLLKKQDFLVRLLENPNILEHESFTHLLRSVFHLTEELANRGDVTQLPKTDLEHLINDIRRAYVQLVRQWLDYMRYLKDNYPFLFSFYMRTNPFDQETSPIVQ